MYLTNPSLGSVGATIYNLQDLRKLLERLVSLNYNIDWIYQEFVLLRTVWLLPDRKEEINSILRTAEDIKVFYDLFAELGPQALKNKKKELEDYVFKSENLERLVKEPHHITTLIELFITPERNQPLTDEQKERIKELAKFVADKMAPPNVFLTDVVDIVHLLKLFPKNNLANFILHKKNSILKNESDIRYFLRFFPDKRESLAEVVLQPQNLDRLILKALDFKRVRELFLEPKYQSKLAAWLRQGPNGLNNLQRLLTRSSEIEYFMGLFPEEAFVKFIFSPPNMGKLIQESGDILKYAQLFPEKREILAEFAFQPENLDRFIAKALDVQRFKELFTEPKYQPKLADWLRQGSNGLNNLQRLLTSSSEIEYFMGLFSKNPFADFIFSSENMAKLIQHLRDVKEYLKLFPERKEQLADFIFSPTNMAKLIQHLGDIEEYLKLFPEKKEQLAYFIFNPENRERLIKNFQAIEYFAELFPEKKGLLAQFVFVGHNEHRLLEQSSGIQRFVKIFKNDISFLIKVKHTFPPDMGLLLDSIIEETFRLNEIEIFRQLYDLGCKNKKHIASARQAASASGYFILEEIFHKLYSEESVSDDEWNDAQKQKLFWDEQVLQGLKLDKQIAKQLTIAQMLPDNLERLRILNNDILIYLIKANIISIEKALALDQNFIQGYREVYESSRELMPLLFGENPVDLGKLILHKENAKLKSGLIQCLIMEGKTTLDDVLSLSDEDMLTIAARGTDISNKLLPNSQITLKKAIEESLENSISCTIGLNQAELMIGPAAIKCEDFDSQHEIIILIDGTAKTGQKAHVFCRFATVKINDDITTAVFRKVFSQMEATNCTAILVSHEGKAYPRLLSFLREKEGIPEIATHCVPGNRHRYFNICYDTNSGCIQIESPKWENLLSFDSLKRQESPNTLEASDSSQAQFFHPAKKRKMDSTIDGGAEISQCKR